ncbi:MAG: hypothetical protein H8K10_05935 [Nitrospira sp.]|nr:hypothetical protein [Nitrospira sp.]
MKAKRTMHVLTDKKGAIVGGGVLTPGKDHKGKPVHIQIEPLKGQSLKEVAIPADLARLEGVEFFRRLQCDFRLPRGKKELVRKAGRR